MNDLVAQLVEQMTLNHWVEGSIPSEVTIIILIGSLLQQENCKRLSFILRIMKTISLLFVD